MESNRNKWNRNKWNRIETHQIPAVGGKGMSFLMQMVSPNARGQCVVVALDAEHSHVVDGGDLEGRFRVERR